MPFEPVPSRARSREPDPQILAKIESIQAVEGVEQVAPPRAGSAPFPAGMRSSSRARSLPRRKLCRKESKGVPRMNAAFWPSTSMERGTGGSNSNGVSLRLRIMRTGKVCATISPPRRAIGLGNLAMQRQDAPDLR